jgi:hypothetical protein
MKKNRKFCIWQKGCWIISLFVALFTFAMVSSAGAAALELDDQSAKVGEEVTFTLSVNTAPNEVKSLGLDIDYDETVLEYKRHAKGDLTTNFDFFNVNNPEVPVDGLILRIGGFEAGDDKIPAGASGTICTLTFEVIGVKDALLGLKGLVDDVNGWSTRDGQFTYPPDLAPIIESINPNHGPPAGGTAVTITGQNFAAGATVTFGGLDAGAVFVNAQTLNCTAPAHPAGPVDVVVTNPDGQSATRAGGYTYDLAPVIENINPDHGPPAGGTAVTITGQNFVAGATVTFGGLDAGAVFVNAQTLNCTAPAHPAGPVDVVVTNPDGQSETRAAGYTYYQDVAIPEIPEGYDPENPDTFPTVRSGDSYDFTVTGGEGSTYEWKVDGPVDVAGGEGASFRFEAPTEGAFAGVYTITVIDDKTGWESSVQVKVPLVFTPKSKNIEAGGSFPLVLAGAAEGTTVEGEFIEITPPLQAGETEDDIATVVADDVFGSDSRATAEVTGADVAQLRQFKIQVTVTGDPNLTEENGLDVVTTGWMRVLPVVTFSGVVQDAQSGDPIGNAAIMFNLGDETKANTSSAPDGTFSVNVVDPDIIDADYNVVVMADNYLPAVGITTADWENPEAIELSAATSSIAGKVTKADDGTGIEDALVACTEEVEGWPVFTYSKDTGDYTLWLPVAVEDLPDLFARASAVGYGAVTQDTKDDPAFELASLGDPPEVCEDGGVVASEGCVVNFPAGALDGCYEVEMDMQPVGVEISPCTSKCEVLVEINLSGGATLQDSIQVTIPFDTDAVGPGDFMLGEAVIYHAPTPDDLREDKNYTAVPLEDIMYQDDLKGLVSFRVWSLSAFSVGSPPPPAPVPGGGGGGGCFIASAGHGLLPHMFLIPLLMLGIALGTYRALHALHGKRKRHN